MEYSCMRNDCEAPATLALRIEMETADGKFRGEAYADLHFCDAHKLDEAELARMFEEKWTSMMNGFKDKGLPVPDPKKFRFEWIPIAQELAFYGLMKEKDNAKN